jgi:hypothetical protein
VPIELVTPPEGRKAAEAALAAVVSRRVFAPLPGRTARVVFVGQEFDRRLMPAPPTEPWIADAIARIAEDDDLRAVNSDGTPSIAAASDGPVLVVRTREPARSLVTLRLLRTVLNALADPSGTALRPSSTVNEILPIPDAQLRTWERSAGEVRTPRLDTLEHDDRRWWWAAALLLLALETWMRRILPTSADNADAISQRPLVSPDERLFADLVYSAGRRATASRRPGHRDRRADGVCGFAMAWLTGIAVARLGPLSGSGAVAAVTFSCGTAARSERRRAGARTVEPASHNLLFTAYELSTGDLTAWLSCAPSIRRRRDGFAPIDPRARSPMDGFCASPPLPAPAG